MPKKPSDADKLGVMPLIAVAKPKMLDRCPMLVSFLTDLWYEGTTESREPSYLIIRARDGEWHVTLKDPTEKRQVRLRVEDLGTAWAALEALLTAPSCPWEPDSWAGKRGPQKRR